MIYVSIHVFHSISVGRCKKADKIMKYMKEKRKNCSNLLFSITPILDSFCSSSVAFAKALKLSKKVRFC